MSSGERNFTECAQCKRSQPKEDRDLSECRDCWEVHSRTGMWPHEITSMKQRNKQLDSDLQDAIAVQRNLKGECIVYLDRTCSRICPQETERHRGQPGGERVNELTEREKWLMQETWEIAEAPCRYESLEHWLNDNPADGASVEMVLASMAPKCEGTEALKEKYR